MGETGTGMTPMTEEVAWGVCEDGCDGGKLRNGATVDGNCCTEGELL